ncbi:Myb-like dna-binding protein, partial [Globisporangium splendens]
MTITSEVKSQFFDKSTNKVIVLPRSAYPGVPIAPASNSASNSPISGGANGTNGAPWTDDEHARFLQGLELFPSGPWKSIAACVGTRTPRQVMSHAQKYRKKIARQQRGVPTGADSNAGSEFSHGSPVYSPSLVNSSLSDMHLTGDLLDEILMSLFEDNNGESLEITQEDLDALMSFQ